MLAAAIQKNDRKAAWLIGLFSVIVFVAVVALGKIELKVDLGFDVHLFAKINAVINSLVAVLLLAGLVAIKKREGSIRLVYFIILITHIFLAAIILPFVLYTAYRALVAEWPAHKKLAKITWPIWFYVAVTGVVVYFMISPYYS